MSELSTHVLADAQPTVDLAEFGSRLAKATGGLRVKAVSWHDADGRVLWSSLPLLGIEQREAIRDALESFSGVGARLRVDRNLGDNQTAVLLRAADREGRTVGFAMLLLDSRVLLSKGRGADLPVPALQIVHEFGRLVAPRARLYNERAPHQASAKTGSHSLPPALRRRCSQLSHLEDLA